jgi:hypothetical protein
MEAILPQETIELIFDEEVDKLVRKDTEGTLSPIEKKTLANYRLQARENYRQQLLSQGQLTPEEQKQLDDIDRKNEEDKKRAIYEAREGYRRAIKSARKLRVKIPTELRNRLTTGL